MRRQPSLHQRKIWSTRENSRQNASQAHGRWSNCCCSKWAGWCVSGCALVTSSFREVFTTSSNRASLSLVLHVCIHVWLHLYMFVHMHKHAQCMQCVHVLGALFNMCIYILYVCTYINVYACTRGYVCMYVSIKCMHCEYVRWGFFGCAWLLESERCIVVTKESSLLHIYLCRYM